MTLDLSPAQEDYLLAVHRLAAIGEVRAGAVAQSLAVSAPSATVMLRRLAQRGLIDRASRDIRLTGAGRREASRLQERRELLHAYLSSELDLPAECVDAEVARLAHYLSPDLEDRIRHAVSRASL
jgi:DtxR family transcriptional regulator, Mn-dependent transcriptional regulator